MEHIQEKTRNYLELSEDGLYIYLFQLSKQHRDQKRRITNGKNILMKNKYTLDWIVEDLSIHPLHFLSSEPERAFSRS